MTVFTMIKFVSHNTVIINWGNSAVKTHISLWNFSLSLLTAQFIRSFAASVTETTLLILHFSRFQESDAHNHQAVSTNRRAAGSVSSSSSLKHLNLNSLCKNQGECYVDEIVLPSESLQSLSELKILSLRNNDIQNFPNSVLQLATLVTLDISDNCLLTLPPEISQLIK